MDFVRRTWAEISLDAITHNFNEIKNKIGDRAKICCVIKADGYGHGAVELAHIYERLGADFFAVSNIDEGIEIRASGAVKLPILILGYTPVRDAQRLAQYNISQAVFSLDYAKALSAQCAEYGCVCKIHIKCDTGIDEGREFTEKQYKNFSYVRGALESAGLNIPIAHCSNSGAIEDYEKTYCDMVRAGIILYGLAPSPKLAGKLDLQPAMTLKTTVAYVKNLKKGADISYGRTFTAEHDMKIATVPIGYADGFVRMNAQDGYMLVNGKRAKIVGRICMDQTMLDVTDIDDVKIGDEVLVFGPGDKSEPTADILAKNTGTINYEVVCLVGKRVPRIYYKNGVIKEVMYKL